MYGCLHSTRALAAVGALVEVAREFTPRVEVVDPATALLDLRGLGRTWSSPHALGEALADAARRRGIEPAVALAWSRTAALLLARSGGGLTVVGPGQEASALASLPLDLLDLSPEWHDVFRRWGLHTLGDLAALPPGGLAERLGPEGPRLIHLARGEDEVPLVATPTPESFDCTLELDWPVEGLEPLVFLLGRVLEPLCAMLASRRRRAAALTLDLHLVDGRHHRRTLRPAAPSAEPRTWRTLLLLDLEAQGPGEAVQAIGVSAEPTLSRIVQFSLLDAAQPSPERLAETMARLHEWTSCGRGGSAALLDTHRPGAFVMGSFAPGPFKEDEAPCVRAPRLALRPFRPPLPAQVTLRAGSPSFVSASGLSGAVASCAGPWRASGDWWDVALQGRGLYRIFRDRLRGGWFVEGELD